MADLMQLRISTGQAINILANNGQINLATPTGENMILVKQFTKFILDCQANNLDLTLEKVDM